MVTYTTTYNLAKPTVADDEDTWGGFLNGNFDTLESLLKGTTALTSLNLSGNITFGDGDRAVFGADSDLQIWFDGTHSRIEDSATNAGDLYIRGSNNLRLQTWDGVSSWQNAIVLDDAGAAELYHDGTITLTTSSSGIDVTGTVTATDLILDGGTSSSVFLQDSTATNGYQLRANVSSSVDGGLLVEDLSGTNIARFQNNGDINFYEDTGTTAKFFWDASAESLGIQTTSPRAPLHVAPAGAASDNFNVLVSQFRPNIVLEDLSTSATDWQLFADGNELQFRYGDASTDTKLANSSMSIQNDGTVIIDAATDEDLILRGTSPYIRFQEGTTAKAYIQWSNAGFLYLRNQEDGSGVRIRDDVEFTPDGTNWYDIWHANNDGSGSGLDADTVDGLQATSFLRSDASDSWSGTLTGSGPITTSSSYIEAGRGSGSVALSINDGYGNANLTFNHRAGVPDVNGQSGRIEVNVDGTTGEGVMYFELSSAPVTSGQAVGLETGLTVAHDYIEVPYRIRHQGDSDTYIEFANNTMNFRTANAHEMQITNNGVLLVNSALHEDYDALSGTSVTVDPNTGGAWSLTMTGNTTFTFGVTVNNYSTGIIIQLTGNGGTVTWPTSVDWAGGTAPDAPASGETDIYVFWTRDGGTTWYGVQSIDAAA